MAPELVYFVLKQGLLNFSETVQSHDLEFVVSSTSYTITLSIINNATSNDYIFKCILRDLKHK